MQSSCQFASEREKKIKTVCHTFMKLISIKNYKLFVMNETLF